MSWEFIKNKLIKVVNFKKVIGLDYVFFRDFFLIGDFVIYSLLLIFRKSVSDVFFFLSWKLLCVNFIFKKGLLIDVNNYRFIFFFSILGKILEDVVSDILNNYMEI